MGGIVSAPFGCAKQANPFNVDSALPHYLGIKDFNGAKIARMPGVGVIAINATTKSIHRTCSTSFSSRSEDSCAGRKMLRSNSHRPSLLAPSVANISSTSS
jgi:hypothetical protein